MLVVCEKLLQNLPVFAVVDLSNFGTVFALLFWGDSMPLISSTVFYITSFLVSSAKAKALSCPMSFSHLRLRTFPYSFVFLFVL